MAQTCAKLHWAQLPLAHPLTCSEQTDAEGARRGGEAEPTADCTGKAATDADKRSRCPSAIVRNIAENSNCARTQRSEKGAGDSFDPRRGWRAEPPAAASPRSAG